MCSAPVRARALGSELGELRRHVMKPINPFPLIAMLVIVIFLVLWLNGVFA